MAGGRLWSFSDTTWATENPGFLTFKIHLNSENRSRLLRVFCTIFCNVYEFNHGASFERPTSKRFPPVTSTSHFSKACLQHLNLALTPSLELNNYNLKPSLSILVLQSSLIPNMTPSSNLMSQAGPSLTPEGNLNLRVPLSQPSNLLSSATVILEPVP